MSLKPVNRSLLSRFFNSGVEVINCAVNGRSSKSLDLPETGIKYMIDWERMIMYLSSLDIMIQKFQTLPGMLLQMVNLNQILSGISRR